VHAGEQRMDVATARTLVAEQFPNWADLPLVIADGRGTVNTILRIGSELAARFPLLPGAPLEAEASASVELAVASPVPTPQPVALGRPGHGYPFAWSVQTWLPGSIATPTALAESRVFAEDLAGLITSLRGADTGGRVFAGSGRGGVLTDHDGWMETCFRESEGLLDVPRLRRIWARLRLLPREGADVMSHGDLTPANILVAGDRLVGVLDGGGFGPADPALDLVAGWHLLDAEARQVFRAAVGCDDLQWERGTAWAFEQAMGLVWYYRDTNPWMSALGRCTLARICS